MNGSISNRKQNFFAIWAGQALSQFSSSTLQFAIVWYLMDQIESVLVLSAAIMAGLLPQGILGPFIGVFIDRYNRKRIMTMSDLLISAASLVMVITGRMGVLSTELILTVLLCHSVGSTFHTPCLQAVTPQIISGDQLTRCAGCSQTLGSVLQILSPVLAAVFYSSWSSSGIVFLDAIGVLTAVFTPGITSIPELPRDGSRGETQVLREAKEGLQVLPTSKGMPSLALIGTLYTLALVPASALFPLMSMSYLSGTSTHASLVEVVFSLGLLFGSLILSRWGGTKDRIHTITDSFLLMSSSLFVSGVLPPGRFSLFAACSWLVGVSGPFYWRIYTLLLQSNFEARYLGCVLSLFNNIRLISGSVGLAVSGVFTETYGIERWFLIIGALVLLVSFLCLAVPAM